MNSKLRTILFWTHLSVGVVAGLFILNMALSGMCIAYMDPLTNWAEQSQRTVTPPAGGSRLDMETLIAKVQESRPEVRFYRTTVFADPTAATLFFVDNSSNVVAVNPYTGAILGEGQKTLRAFFSFMLGWHRWLASEGPTRPIGKAITGAACSAYFILLIIGLLLWLPRKWSRTALKQQVTLNPKLKGKARDWNWHNVIGIWSSPLLLIVTLTGLIMSYSWANNLLFSLTGSPLPERKGEGRPPADKKLTGSAPKLFVEGLNKLWPIAEAQVHDWTSITLRFSNSTKAPVSFSVSRSESVERPTLNSQFSLDRETGEIVRSQAYADLSTGQKLRAWVKPLHTGEAGGIIGETIALLAALGGSLLVWTGLSLAWRRFFGQTFSSPTPTSS